MRVRHQRVEGWTPEHDDQHNTGDMAKAAAAYALSGSGSEPYGSLIVDRIWPWDLGWWKPKDRRRDLVRAGALILAEIERLDRANKNKPWRFESEALKRAAAQAIDDRKLVLDALANTPLPAPDAGWPHSHFTLAQIDEAVLADDNISIALTEAILKATELARRVLPALP